MQQWDIYFVDLNPRKWHTQSGVRPCVIISSDIFNRHAPTVNIIPLTSVIKEPFPSEFLIEPSRENNLKEKSRYLGSQIMTIDKNFLYEKIWILEEKYRNLSRESTRLVLEI